ncbi:hypothetical protein HNP46_000456 [Pseudomonas nitritireducens]|uniref:Uncharacterized protein n=1 Tax=Pseudomonas nitroreducens TaxID=46680 RepID=A0A7W7KFQ4_PSENT|nr:hypothetical protein [Pseudomonas nitritireducens]MBB4861645.1 hypothetical protein [Pseudomonas nitritireducens]
MNASEFSRQVQQERARYGRGRIGVREDDIFCIDRVIAEDLPYIFARAVMYGDEELARVIWGRRGPFKAVIQIPPGPYTRYEIVGEEKTVPLDTAGFNLGKGIGHYLSMLGTADQADSLFSLMLESGLLGESDGGDALSLLLEPDRISETSIHFVKSGPACVEEEIPFLRGGVLEAPELAIAIGELIDSRAFKRAYEQTICWATPDMVELFPNHLRPFKAVQKMSYNQMERNDSTPNSEEDRLRDARIQPLDEFTAQNLWRVRSNSSSVSVESSNEAEWPLTVRSLNVSVLPSNRLNVEDGMLLAMQASLAVRRGFGFTGGKVLCAVSAEFLNSFPSTKPSEGKLDAMRGKLKQYFPLCLVHQHYGQARAVSALLMPISNESYLGRNLASDSAKSPDFAARLRRYLPAKLLGTFIENSFNGEGEHNRMLPLHFEGLRELGFADQPVKAKIDYEDLEAMELKGIMIAAGSSICGVKIPAEVNSELGADTARHAFYSRILSISAGPITLNNVPSDKPVRDVLKELKKFSLKPGQTDSVCVHIALLKHRGVDALVKDLKTSADWKVMFKVFSHEAMRDYMHLAPNEVMTREMSGVLEL